MRPLSEDLRQRIIAARAEGAGTGQVCQRFGVSRKSVERFWNQHGASGHCRPRQIGGSRVSRLKKHEKRLRRWIAQQADLTLVELQQRCQKELEVQIGLTALWHQLDRFGLRYKKTTHATEQATRGRKQNVVDHRGAFLIEGAVNDEVFTAYLRAVLVRNSNRVTSSSSTISPPIKSRRSPS